MANFGKEMLMLRGVIILDVLSRSYTPKGESKEKVQRAVSCYVPSEISDPPAFYEVALQSDDEMRILDQYKRRPGQVLKTADIVIEKEMFGPKFTKYTFMGTFAEYMRSLMPTEEQVKKPELHKAV